MFSCCRSNPKNSKKDKNKKSNDNDNDKDDKDDEGITRTANDAVATNDVNLVIPKINVETGTEADIKKQHESPTAQIDAPEPSKEANTATATATTTATSSTVDVAETAANVEQHLIKAIDNETEIAVKNAQKNVVNKISKAELTNGANMTSVSTNFDGNQTTTAPTCANIAHHFAEFGSSTKDSPTSPTPSQALPKSCLSRHNSMHTSIKKKVNISTRAEIFEAEPLTSIPTNSSLADDDDVFSDSLPPPKRESMCAPYIERDYDDIPETVAFAHGLPDWFDDERLNEIGCIEPPVTPVGRDELELKRQRLYTELLRAAHAAVEHSVRFTPTPLSATGFGGVGPPAAAAGSIYNFEVPMAISTTSSTKRGACDPDLKSSVADNLEHLVNRLELLVERLERSVSARELELANRAFDTVLERKRASIELEKEQSPTPAEKIQQIDSIAAQITEHTDKLSERIERIETSLQRINEHQRSVSSSSPEDGEVINRASVVIPTVIADLQLEEEDPLDEDLPLPPPPPPFAINMSVLGFQDIINGPLSQYLALSAKIGGDVAKHAELVKLAFNAQLQYVTLATQIAQPSQDKQMELLKPTSTQISAIQDYREKQRASPFFNHLSAISESIPALGWVCVAPTPGPHVKEMNDAGQFYTNRVLKEWKEKNPTHVEWARAWIQTLTELQAYIKQYHTTGLVWSGKGSAGGAPPPPPPGGCPPPPPPLDLNALKLDGTNDDRSALFAQINQGEGITKNLKKVTDDMQTHKNPTLRTGPAPFKTPTQFGNISAPPAPAVAKPPVFTRDGKKWLIEYQKNNAGLLVENAEMNNVVYMFRCEGSTLTVKGKVNNIVLDSCKKCSLLFDSVVASIEFVNCQSVQMQVLGHVPTVSIDKTDGCQMYLSKDSLGVEIVSSKSSEMNILLPESNGDYTELAVPEQYKTTISGKTLKTVCVDSLG